MMKKFVFIILGLALVLTLNSCGKKQQSLEEMQVPLSMESLSAMSTVPAASPEAQATKAPESQLQQQAAPVNIAALEPLPPAGPYKPTNHEVQTALKNAGYYIGEIDGKIGPMSKKAIEAFQQANGLKVDGKVGPKTWEVLSKYLNPEPVPAKSGKKKR